MAEKTITAVKVPQNAGRHDVAVTVLDLFWKQRLARDREQDLFRGRTLKGWIDDNVKRFVQFKKRPAHKKNWQSNLASTTPNEKIIGILSKLATRGIEGRVRSLKDISVVTQMKEKVSNWLLKAAAIKNDDDFQIVLEMLEALEKGTVIGFEDWYHGRRKIREILDQDEETGELKFTEKTIDEWNDVRSSLVALEDFYPGDIYVRPGRIQDMDFCFLRTRMKEDEFKAEFGSYPDADKVFTRMSWGIVNESAPFWRQSEDVVDDEVELIRYFNKKTDEYVILANEIWINPKGNLVQPLPWNHKKLPFWAAVGEPLDASFFYGRSLIDKLIAFCDSKDGLLDRILDQATLAVSRPIVTDGSAASALTKGFLQPSNVITTDWADGRPKFEVVPIPDVPPSAVSLYQILQQNLEQTSISAEAVGGAGNPSKTATQASIELQGVNDLVSLTLRMMEIGIRDKLRLRFPNILQFYTLPSNQDDGVEKFRKVVLRDEKLNDGKIGSVQLEITPSPSQERTELARASQAEPVEFIEITPSFLRDFDADVEIVPQSSIKMTPAQRQVLETNYQNVMLSLYPDLFNRQYGFEQLNLSYDKDPRQAKAEQQEPAMVGAMPTMPPQQQPAPELPGEMMNKQLQIA